MSSLLNSVLVSCLQDICNEHNLFETVLGEDFNLPDISWDTCNLKTSNITTNQIFLQQLEFMTLLNQLGMKWNLINEITRHKLVKGVLQESLLDQVLYKNEALVFEVKLLSSLGKSDHFCI